MKNSSGKPIQQEDFAYPIIIGVGVLTWVLTIIKIIEII